MRVLPCRRAATLPSIKRASPEGATLPFAHALWPSRAEGWNELLPDLAADLVRWRVAVLAAVARRPGSPFFVGSRELTGFAARARIPIVRADVLAGGN